MVTDKESRNYPQYALERIRQLAAAGEVAYGTSRVQHDAANLDYELNDVCTVLRLLGSEHFHESVRYDGTGPWLDAYRISCDGPANCIDDLYIKLKLNQSCVLVVLASFHRDRNL